jgi:uncharacterized protein HemY
MKKTDLLSSLFVAGVNVKIGVKANVKIGGGGGYVSIKIARIIVTIILCGFLPNFFLVFLVLLLLSFLL